MISGAGSDLTFLSEPRCVLSGTRDGSCKSHLEKSFPHSVIRGNLLFARMFLLPALMICIPQGSRAQQSPPERQQLTDQQRDGRRIFQQRCAICHTPPTVTSKRYGPALYGDVVDGYEDGVRQMIMEGREQLMPGFKYTLSRPEIDSIIEYLRIVPKPARAPKGGSQQNTVD